MISENAIRLLESYLREEFPDSFIEGSQTEQGGYLFRINQADLRYTLYADESAFSNKDEEAIEMFLHNCDVSSVLRHVGEFAVSLTHSGCILGYL